MPTSGSGAATGIITPTPPVVTPGPLPFSGFNPASPYGDVASSSLFVPLPAGSVVSRLHPDYTFEFLSNTLFYVDEIRPIPWRITRTDSGTPARPTAAVVKVRDSSEALVATLSADLSPWPAAESVELAALWQILAKGTYSCELTVTLPTDGQVRSGRVIVEVH